MLKAYKYRLYPTAVQKELINKHIGSCRFVYNLALEVKNMAYAGSKKNISVFELMRQITDLKKEYIWLKEVDSQALQQSLLDLDKAFTLFFKGQNNFPVFKNKHTKQSFRNPHGKRVIIQDGKLIQAKFKSGIKIIIDRPYVGEIRNTTISKSPTGKYYVSLLCEKVNPAPVKKPINENTSIGIDLGIKDFIVSSNGEKINNPQYLKSSMQRLKVLQRRMRNKKKGSSNKRKAYKHVALLHEKIVNQRKDFLQKLSTKLIRENQTICLEDLNIKGMVKNHCLAGSISDAGWGMFVEMLKYKSEWKGSNFLQIPRFEPSTKLCSDCGATKQDLTLSDREWTCSCGSKHDRDINAAINIKNYCIRHSGEGISGVPVELPTLVGAMKQEIIN